MAALSIAHPLSAPSATNFTLVLEELADGCVVPPALAPALQSNLAAYGTASPSTQEASLPTAIAAADVLAEAIMDPRVLSSLTLPAGPALATRCGLYALLNRSARTPPDHRHWTVGAPDLAACCVDVVQVSITALANVLACFAGERAVLQECFGACGDALATMLASDAL